MLFRFRANAEVSRRNREKKQYVRIHNFSCQFCRRLLDSHLSFLVESIPFIHYPLLVSFFLHLLIFPKDLKLFMLLIFGWVFYVILVFVVAFTSIVGGVTASYGRSEEHTSELPSLMRSSY